MQYQIYLFDFDYTLANSEKGIVTCFQHVFTQNGFMNIDDETIKHTIGLTLEEAFSQMTGITDSTVIADYRKQYVAKSDEVMTANTIPYPDTLSTLTTLKENGAIVGIISTKYRYRVAVTVEEYGLPVDVVIGGDDVAAAKPDPEGIRKALTQFNMSAVNALYVGDSLVDAQAAYNAGVDFAAVTTGTTTHEDFQHWPHVAILSSLSGVITL